MRRFLIPQECTTGDIVTIKGQEAHHLLDVLRLKRGDRVELFDGRGKSYQGRISDTQLKKVKVKIERVQIDCSVSNLEITLIQALPKLNRMDCIVEKSTELGVDVIIPTQTARTIVKLEKARFLRRRLRWQRIAQEAAKQCGRTTIPRVRDLTSWTDILSTLDGFDLKLLPCLSGNRQKIQDVLRAQNKLRPCTAGERGKPKRVALFIGPEGDFTPSEIQKASNAGCKLVSLGTNVLKSDTAAACALAMINYALR